MVCAVYCTELRGDFKIEIQNRFGLGLGLLVLLPQDVQHADDEMGCLKIVFGGVLDPVLSYIFYFRSLGEL